MCVCVCVHEYAHTHTYVVFFFGTGLTHRLPTRTLQEYRPLGGLHHVQGLRQAPPARRAEDRQGPHEGATLHVWGSRPGQRRNA